MGFIREETKYFPNYYLSKVNNVNELKNNIDNLLKKNIYSFKIKIKNNDFDNISEEIDMFEWIDEWNNSNIYSLDFYILDDNDNKSKYRNMIFNFKNSNNSF
jgi:hypothetical protein